MVICNIPLSINYINGTNEDQWNAAIAAGTFRTISAADIPDGGSILIDLNLRAGNFSESVPVQIIMRPSITHEIGAYVSDSDKWANLNIASVVIKGA